MRELELAPGRGPHDGGAAAARAQAKERDYNVKDLGKLVQINKSRADETLEKMQGRGERLKVWEKVPPSPQGLLLRSALPECRVLGQLRIPNQKTRSSINRKMPPP